MGCDPLSWPYMGIQTIHGFLKIKKYKNYGVLLLIFSKPYMGSLKRPCIKVTVFPPPTTTTTTRVTSRPASLRPQVKRRKRGRKGTFIQGNTPFIRKHPYHSSCTSASLDPMSAIRGSSQDIRAARKWWGLHKCTIL